MTTTAITPRKLVPSAEQDDLFGTTSELR